MSYDTHSRQESREESFTTPVSSISSSPAIVYSPLYVVDPEQQQGQPVWSYVSPMANGRIPSGYSHVSTTSRSESPYFEHDANAPKVVYSPETNPSPNGLTSVPEEDLPVFTGNEEKTKSRKLLCGCLPIWLFSRLVVGTIIALGIGLGLGLGMKKKCVQELR
jgi:hypothetical protein